MAAKRKESRMVTHPLGTEIYSVKQVAESLGLSTKTIYEAIEAGKLKAKKTGKQFLITREAVREYWESLPNSGKAKRET
jgi:excisionase family DNA binding protein